MRYVFRALALIVAVSFFAHLSVAQKSVKEVADESGRSAEDVQDDLNKDGNRESHEGADNPVQGNRTDREGRFGGPDPYGPENYDQFIEKAERQLNDPQWQLKVDLHHPKRIVVNHADGSSEEYWYVLFRVVNDNIRNVKETELPDLNPEDVDLANPPSPLEVEGGVEDNKFEGVPVNAHLDFELHVFTVDMEKNRWDTEPPADPDDDVLSDEQKAARLANRKAVYKPVSDHYALQKIAEAEGLYEWMGNYNYVNEAVMLLHPLSDFQRQIGHARDLDAPDLSGPRCLPYRAIVIENGERSDAMRYVAVYDDDTFAGIYGEGDDLPDGARLVNDEGDDMWGKLTQRRYNPGDCIDRNGRVLRVNDPGYLNARVAGGRDPSEGSYGVIGAGHPAVGEPVQVPHARTYRDGDRVLFDYDTGLPHADYANETYRINGMIVGPADPRYGDAEEIGGSTEMFGGDVVGRPAKMIDSRGRAIRKYVVTYQAGDRISEAEWNVWRMRIGDQLLARYTDLGNITDRALTADDPVIGLPKIKVGRFIGDNAEDADPEIIQRGIDTGRRGDQGEVILDLQEYTTGRRYSPKNVDPEDFLRDPDGEFFTHRIAPVPDGANLNAGEEYIYAPLGNAEEDAMPVPHFDKYGAWEDYYDEVSGNRIPLRDSEGKLVRDEQDQILYLKEYEYEYVYMYEMEVLPREDDGFLGEFGGEPYKLKIADSDSDNPTKFVISKQIVRSPETNADGSIRRDAEGNPIWKEKEVEIVLPLVRRIYKDGEVTTPVVVAGYEVVDNGEVRYVTAEEYEAIKGAPPGDDVVEVRIVRQETATEPKVMGVYHENRELKEGERAESWEEAEARAVAEGGVVEERNVIGYLDRFRKEKMAEEDARNFDGDGPKPSDFEETDPVNNGMKLEKSYKTWSRWTVPPPLVYETSDGQWRVLTRFADKVGPANRWDGADAPRFLTRYISEMWGVAIFKDVRRDWDFANVYVRGLRGHVSNDGLKLDGSVTDMPSPVGDGSTVKKSFFNPRYVSEDWVYRVRYERFGDAYENYRDLVRRVRTFWYRESEEELTYD